MKTITFHATNTTCESCARTIERQALKIQGVKSARYDDAAGKGTVTYDENLTSPDAIFASIRERGYGCETRKPKLGLALGVIGLAMLVYGIAAAKGVSMPAISQGMGLGLLFVVGLLTGFHCVSMCGGFVLGYTASNSGQSHAWKHAQYAAGKLASYTVIGALFGLLGSIIAFTPTLRGAAAIIAGLFLLLFGLRMLRIIPRFGLPMPRSVAPFFSAQRSPLAIGLLNGLMIACGPLQAIYVLAAGTGNAAQGALMLFVFGLGTLPVMLLFGTVASSLSVSFRRHLNVASGAIVMVLGLLMVSNGFALAGYGSLLPGGAATGSQPTQAGYQEIRMDVLADGWHPNTFTLQKGVPVRWIINGKDITSCNNAIQVPKLGLRFDVKPGEQVIEFTPTEEGTIAWSCWMGMIPGRFVVADDPSTAIVQEQVNTQIQGGCGCGMRNTL